MAGLAEPQLEQRGKAAGDLDAAWAHARDALRTRRLFDDVPGIGRERADSWSALSPLGRLAEPGDVARAALFLASSDSDYLTGDALNVSGGMLLH